MISNKTLSYIDITNHPLFHTIALNIALAMGPILVVLLGLIAVANGQTPCNDVDFLYCQNRFNTYLGIDTTWTWKNATLISIAVRDLMRTDTAGVNRVCQARTLHFQCLGASYIGCIDRYYLTGRDPTVMNEAFEYVRLMRQLWFVCNAGYEEYMARYDCLTSAYTLPATTACIAAFNSSFSNNAARRCDLVNTLMSCIQPVYTTACNNAFSGWWICEDIRFSFAEDCPNLRCYIGDN